MLGIVITEIITRMCSQRLMSCSVATIFAVGLPGDSPEPQLPVTWKHLGSTSVLHLAHLQVGKRPFPLGIPATWHPDVWILRGEGGRSTSRGWGPSMQTYVSGRQWPFRLFLFSGSVV